MPNANPDSRAQREAVTTAQTAQSSRPGPDFTSKPCARLRYERVKKLAKRLIKGVDFLYDWEILKHLAPAGPYLVAGDGIFHRALNISVFRLTVYPGIAFAHLLDECIEEGVFSKASFR